MESKKLNALTTLLLEGDSTGAKAETETLVKEGYTAEDIVRYSIEPAAETLDEKCTTVQFNLLEIMLFGRAVTDIMKILYPSGTETNTSKGTIVLATMEGDVHDLGKNITKMVLGCKGYKIIDCGKNCPISIILAAVAKEKPIAVGISGLISSAVALVKKLKSEIEHIGLSEVKVIAGGAALKQLPADKLNVDYVAETAFDIDKYLINL